MCVPCFPVASAQVRAEKQANLPHQILRDVCASAGPQLLAVAVLLAALYALPMGGIGAAYVALACISLVVPNYTHREPLPSAVPPPRAVWRQHHVQTVLYVGLFSVQACAQYLLTASLVPASTQSCHKLRQFVGLQCSSTATSPLVSTGVPVALLALLACQRCALLALHCLPS